MCSKNGVDEILFKYLHETGPEKREDGRSRGNSACRMFMRDFTRCRSPIGPSVSDEHMQCMLCSHCVTFDLGPHLSKLLEGELVAGLGQLLDDLADPVPGQRQVRGSEELVQLDFADESVFVHICKRTRTRRGQRSQTGKSKQSFDTIFIQEPFV